MVDLEEENEQGIISKSQKLNEKCLYVISIRREGFLKCTLYTEKNIHVSSTWPHALDI